MNLNSQKSEVRLGRYGDSNLNHTLQHAATHCNTLQHTVIHYNTLQHNGSLQWFELLGRCNEKRLYSAKETFNLKESTTHSDSSCRGGAIRGDQIPSQRLLDFASIDSIESRESSWSAMRGDIWIPSQRLLNWDWKFRGLDWLNRVRSWRRSDFKYFGSGDLSGLPIDFSSDRDTVYSRGKWLDYHSETSTLDSQLRSMQLHRLVNFVVNSVEMRGLWIWQTIE